MRRLDKLERMDMKGRGRPAGYSPDSLNWKRRGHGYKDRALSSVDSTGSSKDSRVGCNILITNARGS